LEEAMKDEAAVAEAAKEFVLDYLSDNDEDIAERDTWCALLDKLEEAIGKDVFELADQVRMKKLAERGP
jgi:hypothetical protein